MAAQAINVACVKAGKYGKFAMAPIGAANSSEFAFRRREKRAKGILILFLLGGLLCRPLIFCQKAGLPSRPFS